MCVCVLGMRFGWWVVGSGAHLFPPFFVVRGECSLGATILFPSRFSSNLFCECVCSCLFVCVGVHECVYIFGVMGRGMLGEDDGGKHVMQFITYLSSLIGDRNVHPP